MGTTYVFAVLLLVDWLVGFVVGWLVRDSWNGRSRREARRVSPVGLDSEASDYHADIASQCESLQVNVRRELASHLTALEEFEEWLSSIGPGSDQGLDSAWTKPIERIQMANRQITTALDIASKELSGIFQCYGSLLAGERRHMKVYRGRASELDQTLAAAQGEAADEFQAEDLAAKVHELQRENTKLQQELTCGREDLAKQMAAADAAVASVRVDAMTQLPNRRAFEEKLSELQLIFEREEKTYALILFDVDGFQEIGDTHGHAVGDAVVSMVARVFRENKRTTHYVFRFGGEEFAVLLPGGDLRQALSVGERYRDKVEAASLRVSENEITVTVSGGAAQACDEESRRGVVVRADAARDTAKRAGGNRICPDGQMKPEAALVPA